MAATTTLLGLPAELRLLVLSLVAAGHKDTVEYLPFADDRASTITTWEQHNPLLYVCRQIRREACDIYRFKLHLNCRYHRTNPNNGYPPATVALTSILPYPLTQSIAEIRIRSPSGYEGSMITKPAFPRLRKVTLEEITEIRSSDNSRQEHSHYGQTIISNTTQYRIGYDGPDVTVEDVEGGNYDQAILARAKKVVELTMKDVAPLDERVYSLVCQARVMVVKQYAYKRPYAPICTLVSAPSPLGRCHC